MMELKKYKLGELINVTRGACLLGENYSTTGKYIRLTCGNFDYNNNWFKENTSKENIYYIGTIREEFIMKKGDIITPLTEQAIGLLGSTAFIPESNKYIQSQDIAKIVCKNDLLDHNYCFYLISSDIVKQQLSAGAQQTKIRHTSPDKIKDCTVWIPNIEKQKKIGNLFSSLDNLISLKREENRTLEAMAKEIYDYWFVQFDFPDKNGKPYKTSGGKMVYNDVLKREIPEGWEAGKLGDLFDSQAGFAFKSSNWTEFGHPVLTIKNICDDGSIDLSCTSYIEKYDSKYERYSVNNGNMIFAMSGNTIGKIGIISSHIKNILINQRVLIIKTDLSNIAFVYFTTRDKKVQNLVFKLGANSAQPNISEEEYKSISICLPDRNIMNLYNISKSSLFEKIIQNRQQIQTLTALRDYLLPLLMNGQVEVKEAEAKVNKLYSEMAMVAEPEEVFGK